MRLLGLALLPTRPTLDLSAVFARNRATFGDFRMEGDGDTDSGGNTDTNAGGTGSADRGYPENTPLAEMTVEQREKYWIAQARKHEGTAKARSDYDQLKAKAEQYDALEAASRTEQERAVEAAKAEGRAEAAAIAAGQRLVGLLVARGKTEDEADEIVEDLNLTRYVKDGKPDRAAMATLVDRLAPKTAGGAGDGNKDPDLGQGQRKQQKLTGREAGLAEAQRRFGTKN